MPEDSSPSIAILLCTRNAGGYLAAQLDSLASQHHTRWCLWVSDDGSTDATRAQLRARQTLWGNARLQLLDGPQAGPGANFMSLVHHPGIRADYYAYCDQDDVWLPDKLARAVSRLQSMADGAAPDTPLLYGSRTRYIDACGEPLGESPHYRHAPCLRNALVQNIAGGNTMVFNEATRRRLRHLPPEQPVAMHDWWTYIVVMACGGHMHFDPQPGLLYRQHDTNAFGRNTGTAARLRRLRQALQGRLRSWNDIHLAALARLEALDLPDTLTPQSRRTITQYRRIHEGGIWQRPLALYRSRVFRQGRSDHLVLILLALLGRL